MKTYKIEQAQYNLKWHKDEETLEKFELNIVFGLKVKNDYFGFLVWHSD